MIFIPFISLLLFLYLQLPNLRQVSGQTSQPPVDEGQLGQPAMFQPLSGVPPHAQIKSQSGLMPNIQEAQVSTVRHNPLAHNQITAHPKPPLQPRMQLPQHPSNPVVPLGTLPGHSTVPSVRPQPLGSLSIRPPIHLATSTSLNLQMHAPLLQHSGQVGSSVVGQNIRMVHPEASFQVPIFVIFMSSYVY